MNAYELADELVRTPYEPIKADCAAMLRQQAQEISTLSDRIAELEKQSKLQGNNKVKDEPVAWIFSDNKTIVSNEDYQLFQPTSNTERGQWTPLYTHPAKTQADIEYEADKAYWRNRTLTDEEIKQLIPTTDCIAELEKECKDMQERMIVSEQELNHMRSFFGCDPAYYGMTSAEPVAIRYDFDGYGYQYMDSGSGSDWQTRVKGEFLYTTPHHASDVKQIKELSDEEILFLCDDHKSEYGGIDPIGFAKAILKKASEK